MKLKLIFCILSFLYVQINIVTAQPLASDTLAMIDRIFSGWKDSALRTAKNKRALQAVSPNIFVIENILFDFPTENGNPASLKITNPAGDTSTYLRVIPFTPDEKALTTYTGTYLSEEADVTLKIILKDGKLHINRDAGMLIPLSPIYLNCFETSNQGQLLFNKNETSITGFGWTVSRAYNNVWFKKIN